MKKRRTRKETQIASTVEKARSARTIRECPRVLSP